MKFATPLVAAAAMLVAACAQENAPRAVPAATPAARHQPSISIGASGPLEPRPPRVPASYNSVNTSRPVVALTFDDGPHPEFTPRLLDILRHEGIRATFYVIGRNVQTYPEIARRIVAEGHEIANHSWSHPRLTALSASRLKTEMTNTSDIIQKVTGRRPTNMRPPYGAINDRVRQTITRDHGLDVIMWSVDPLDWKRPGAEVVRRRMVEGATPGGNPSRPRYPSGNNRCHARNNQRPQSERLRIRHGQPIARAPGPSVLAAHGNPCCAGATDGRALIRSAKRRDRRTARLRRERAGQVSSWTRCRASRRCLL